MKCLFFNKIVIFPAVFHRIRSHRMKGGRENDTTFKQLTPADLVLPASSSSSSSSVKIVSFFLLPPCYRKIMYTSMCACVCEIHTIYIYRSLYCLYLVAVLISARRPLCTFIPVVIYLPAQPHQHHREKRPCRDIGRKRTDLSVSQSATRGLSPRHVRLEDTVKHISHRHHDRCRVGSVRVSD